jgi:hypothetical protein
LQEDLAIRQSSDDLPGQCGSEMRELELSNHDFQPGMNVAAIAIAEPLIQLNYRTRRVENARIFEKELP